MNYYDQNRFKYRHDDDGDDEIDANPAVQCSRKLEYAIRQKASQEEIFELLSEVPKPSSAFGMVPNWLRSVRINFWY